MPIKLIADSGSTKAEWCLLDGKKKRTFVTEGLSPYFLSGEQIQKILEEKLKAKMKNIEPDEIFFYGTGCSNPDNVKLVKKAIQKVFAKWSRHLQTIVQWNGVMFGLTLRICKNLFGTGTKVLEYSL